MTTETPAPEVETGSMTLADNPDHQAIVEVGQQPKEPDAAPTLSAPAPTAETAAPAAAAPAAPTDPAAKPASEQPFWYRKEIEKERKQRQQLERELEQARRTSAAPQPALSEEDLNRPLTRAELESYTARQQLVGRLERSEERFTDKHGDEAFEATREWLATRPDIEDWALKQRDPWKAAHDQFNKERLASEIGEDPNAWRERERERIRQEILAEQQRAPTPAPATPPQMRATPPLPASTARSAAPRDPAGRFTGPAPIGSLSKNRFG